LHIIRTWHRATFFCAAQLRDGGKQWKTIFKTLLNGLLIGISVAAPVGAMGVLIIRRTLAYGAPAGFVSGLGVATADASYALIAAFGLTFISNALIDAQAAIRLVGGLFLLYLGWRTILSPPAFDAARASRTSLAGSYGSAMLLTFTNPSTILMFAGIFAGAGLASTGDSAHAALMVIGVFLGSTLWWLFLSGSVSRLRARFTSRVLQWINRTAGAIIAAYGLFALAGLLGM